MKPYDVKYLWKSLGVIFLMMLLCKFSQGAAIIIAFPFLVMAFAKKKPESQLFWLMFLMVSVVINSYFLPKGSLYGYAQRASLLIVGLLSLPLFIGQKKNKILAAMIFMFLYLIYMIIPSSTGWWPMVSYMKLFLYATVFLALLGITNSITQSRIIESGKTRSVFLAFVILLVFGSMALIPFPAIGQLSGEEYEMAIKAGKEVNSLFKGMTIQSQALGPIASTIGVLLIADLFFGIKKFDRLYAALLICIPYLIYTTSSRTAMGSFIVGCLVLLMFFMSARNVSGRWRGKVVSWASGIIILMTIIALCSPGVQSRIMGYVLKTTNSVEKSDVTFEKTISSRQALIDDALADFKRNPMLGNGFQVDGRLVYTMGDAKGLILSAPVEKGVWITAILQEGGVVGFIIYIGFMLAVGFAMKSRKCYCALLMFILLHITNLGEFTMFSMSGGGGFLWTMVFLGVVMDEVRIRDSRQKYGLMRSGYRPVSYNPMWR